MGAAGSGSSALDDRPPSELVLDDRVHRSLYTDPRVFELEAQAIFERTWVYVGHESELPHPGDYKTAEIANQPIIVSRDELGELHVLYNRCPHRGTTVCEEERGTANFFRCPYHGWTFKNTGKITGVTLPDGYPDGFDINDYGLSPVARVDMYRGLIFASLAPEGPSLDEHLGRAREYIDLKLDAAPEGRYELRSPSRCYVGGNWKLQMENSVDGYHGTFVHQSFLNLQPRNLGSNQGVDVGRDYGAEQGLSVDLGGGHSMLDNRSRLGTIVTEFTKNRPGGAQYWEMLVARLGPERAQAAVEAGTDAINLEIFPNLVLIANQVRLVRPCAVDRTEIELYPLGFAGAPPEFEKDQLRVHEMRYGSAGFVGPDDLEVFRRVQRGLQAKAVEWVLFERGMHRTEKDHHGALVACSADEVPQRAFWREWKRLVELCV